MKRVLLGLAAALLFAAPAQADVIQVTSTADTPGTCPGAQCTLRAAVTLANSTPAEDTILAQDPLYVLTEGPLPAVTAPLTLNGDGANETSIQADADGGRIVTVGEEVPATIADVTLQGGNNPDGGGALLSQGGIVTLDRVRVTGAGAGGAVANHHGTMVISASLIDNSTALGDSGGGIANVGDALEGASLTVNQSTIAFNHGVGLVSTGNAANTVITNGVTIAQNHAIELGAGVHIAAGTWSPTFTLVSDNFMAQQTPSNCTGTDGASQGWNVENFAQCGFTQEVDEQVLDTRLATILDVNGGPTLTMKLNAGSPALSIRTTGCTGTDQRGVARPQGSGCDAGAFESELVPGPPPTITPLSNPYRNVRETPLSGTAQPGETVEIYLGFALQQTATANAQGAWATEVELPDDDGTYTYEARTPTSTTGATVVITLDRDDPETTIDTRPSNPSTSSTAAFTYSSDEDETTFACRMMPHTGPEFTACPAVGQTYTGLTSGEYTFEVRAVDRAGNADESVASYTFVVNAGDGPVITTPGADARVRPTFILQGTSTPGATIAVTLGTQAVGGGAADMQGLWAVSVGVLPEGEQTLSVTADNGPATTRRFLVDPAPAATIDQRPPATINRGEATFTYSSNEPGTFRCRLVGPGRDDNEEPCPNAGTSYTGLGDGTFEFRVRAVDQTGEGETAVYAFTVDSALIAAPDVSAPATEPTAATFTFSTTQADRTFRCRLEGPGQDGAFADCASPQRYPDLQAGAYRFTVRSSDRSGNFADTVREFTVAGPAVAPQQTATPTPTPTPRPTESPAPQPEQNETVVVRPTGGKVLIQIPPSKEFIELKSIDDIPLGATIDAKNGRVQLRFESEPGKVQIAVFYGGIFQVRQIGKILDLKLTEQLAACPKKKKGGKASLAQSKSKPKKRKLWGDGKGSFRTTGKYSAATVRGTKWLIEDSCAGTLTRVVSGVVAVKDRKKTILLRAGKRYLAKAR